MKPESYYEELEEEVLDVLRASTGVGGLCDTDVCDSILLHVRACYEIRRNYPDESPLPTKKGKKSG